jgi:invasion protein IalB
MLSRKTQNIFVSRLCLAVSAGIASVLMAAPALAQETNANTGEAWPQAEAVPAKPTKPAAAKPNKPAAKPGETPADASSVKPAPGTTQAIISVTEPQKDAPKVTQKPGVFGDWVLQCAKGSQDCTLHQRLADNKGRKVLAFKAARTPKSTLYLEVSAPLGLSIPYGVKMILPDSTEVPMQLADCDATGCRAVMPIGDGTLTKLKTLERLGIRFQDSKSGKVLTISGSLKGFADGIAKVQGAG